LPDRFAYERDKPYYENALIFGLKKHVYPGDRVTIIGGGFGVTAVIASNLSGPSGIVSVFEGSGRQIEICKHVFDENVTPALIKLEHRIVGESISVYGDACTHAPHLHPEELDACDVLQLDCEGSELGILKLMHIKPRIILVETHGILGAPTRAVEEILLNLQYDVRDLGFAEIDQAEYCFENDIRVLLATRRGGR
jgi:hypothetical protein